MILHRSHRRTTDAETFIVVLSFSRRFCIFGSQTKFSLFPRAISAHTAAAHGMTIRRNG
jgi:hypothetical protein